MSVRTFLTMGSGGVFASVFVASANDRFRDGLASRPVGSSPRADAEGSGFAPEPLRSVGGGVGSGGPASGRGGRLADRRRSLRPTLRTTSTKPLALLALLPPCQGGNGRTVAVAVDRARSLAGRAPGRAQLRRRARTPAHAPARRAQFLSPPAKENLRSQKTFSYNLFACVLLSMKQPSASDEPAA